LKKILLAILLIGAVAGGIAYYKWNKPHLDVKDASGIKISAAKLYNTFATDSATAKKTYTDKVLEIDGEVASTSKNQQNQMIIVLKVDSTDASVNCTMEEKDVATSNVGSKIAIKGICNGYLEGDLGLSGNVVVDRCYIVK